MPVQRVKVVALTHFIEVSKCVIFLVVPLCIDRSCVSWEYLFLLWESHCSFSLPHLKSDQMGTFSHINLACSKNGTNLVTLRASHLPLYSDIAKVIRRLKRESERKKTGLLWRGTVCVACRAARIYQKKIPFAHRMTRLATLEEEQQP